MNYSDRTDGFYRRLMLIRFDHTIPDDKKDGNLKEKLMMEKDGILAWAMVGLKRLMQNNYRFTETDRTRAELASYKSENSSVLEFVEECCEVKPNTECLRDELYAMYVEYRSHSGGGKPASKKTFNRELDGIAGVERGLESVSRRKTWRGIRAP
jgi:putative DNA primase/helicase